MSAQLKERRSEVRPNPRKEMFTRLVTITPEMAERFLRLNTRNRKFSEARVKAGEREWLDNGPPKASHQGIAFYAEDGALADGQHRLLTCARTGIAFVTLVTWGLPEDAAINIDRHRPRSEADVVKISGISHWIGRPELALVKMIMAAHGFNPSTYSVPALVYWGEQIADQVVYAQVAFDGRKRAHLTTSPVMAAVAMASEHVDQERLFEFVEVLITGMAHSDDDVAAIRLRDQLMKGESRGGRAARQEVILRTQRAIKAFCDREHLKRLGAPEKMIYRLGVLDE